MRYGIILAASTMALWACDGTQLSTAESALGTDDAGTSSGDDGGMMNGCNGGPGGDHHGGGPGHGGPGGPGGPGRIDPAAAQAACASLAEGDACTLTNGTDTIDGTCRLDPRDNTTLGCRPNPPQALIDACAGLTDGTTCSFAAPDGTNVNGTCRAAPDGNGPVLCLPDRPDHPDHGGGEGGDRGPPPPPPPAGN